MEPQVTGNGQQIVKLMPDTMEVTINLQVSDDQFDKALATIQQQVADIEKALHALRTAPAEVKSEGPWLGPVAAADQNAIMRQQMLQAMGRATAQQPEEKAKVMLSMTLTAKWKLTAREGVALLKETHALEEAVRAALPKPPEVAATEEQVQAMLSAAQQMGEGEEPPGTPTFSFTATIPADKAAEARAQAFKKSREDAESLAQAAGLKLGALSSLSGGISPAERSENYSFYVEGRVEGVARSAQARELTFTVSMEAVFDIAPGQ
jgi:hypothetical protein